MSFRVLASVLAFFLLIGGAASAQSSEPIASFKRLVERASSEKDAVFVGRIGSAWVKHHDRISDVKYDVRKTDSLINPMVGISSFNIWARTTSGYTSEIDAENSPMPGGRPDLVECQFTYHFEKGRWKTARFSCESILNGSRYTAADLKQHPILSKWAPGL